MRYIPAIDMLDAKAVRLKQGDYDQKKVYHDDIVSLAKIFHGAGCKRIHLVDLNGSKAGQVYHRDQIADVVACGFDTVQVGGGIRSYSQVEELFENCLRLEQDYLIVGSLMYKNPDEFKKIAKKFASQMIVSLDVWNREVKIAGWTESTNNHINEALKSALDSGVTQFVVTQILSDGMLTGPDFLLYEEIFQSYPEIKLIASGGVSCKEDLFELEKKFPHLEGAIIGKAFYEGRIALSDFKPGAN